MRHSSIRRAAVAAAVIATLTLAGCSGDSSDEDGGGGTSGGDDGSSQIVNDAGVEDIDLDDAVATQTVKNPGSDNSIEIKVFPIEVEGKVQTLRLAFTPHLAATTTDTFSLFKILGNRVFSPSLVDRDNLKVYSPISDGPDSWTIDNVDARAGDGETIIAWAVYAAPEDDVDAFDVTVKDGWPAFTDVPVQR